MSKRSGAAALVERAMSVGGVLDDIKRVSAGDLQQRIHVHDLPVEVNGQDCFGARGDGCFDLRYIHVECHAVDIHKDRRCAGVGDGEDGRNIGVGNSDDLIARPHAAGQQRQVQRFGAVSDADAVRRLAVCCEFLLEGGDLRAQRIAPAWQHLGDGRADLILDTLVLARDVLGRNNRMRRRRHGEKVRTLHRWFSTTRREGIARLDKPGSYGIIHMVTQNMVLVKRHV